MKTLHVDLGARSYPIFIHQHILSAPDLVKPYVKGEQVMLVSNTTVAPLYLAQVQTAFADFQTYSVILPDGEQHKTLTVLNQIFDDLLQNRCDRQTTLVALGGGVVGDMTGFAAACYQRGVPFIQIPTTLLAQVDSSVGGKTGVNHPLGKNMLGAFHQPECVVIDIDTLNTLEDRQLSAGLAEVVKYGLIGDLAFFEWLESNTQSLVQRDPAALGYAIERSCLNKARIVAADEKEAGVRALLNLGHTFGHAIETATQYQYLHGEGVAIGICLAAQLSHRLGWLSETAVERIVTILAHMQLPTAKPADLSADTLIDLMKVDKKVKAGVIRLILLQAIGQGVITADYESALLREVLN